MCEPVAEFAPKALGMAYEACDTLRPELVLYSELARWI